jgi:membrane associated rhomboid family serine protease
LQIVIPISDDNPTRIPAIVNWAIILACVAAFLWEISLGHEMEAAIAILGFTPDALSGPAHRLPGYIAVPGPATILTSMFLHGGWLHIGGNMLYLWIFGNNIEDAMGHLRYLLFYLLCGIAAALTMALVDPHSHIPMVGASGAISGVLAAYLLLYPRVRVTVIVPLGIIFYPLAISAMWVIGFWFVLQLISAALTPIGQPGVAFWAHVGGFIVGLLLTPLFKSRQYRLFRGPRRGPWG